VSSAHEERPPARAHGRNQRAQLGGVGVRASDERGQTRQLTRLCAARGRSLAEPTLEPEPGGLDVQLARAPVLEHALEACEVAAARVVSDSAQLVEQTVGGLAHVLAEY
jgi:hypothetical protein